MDSSLQQTVNIAEIKIAFSPTILICVGLGSCIGVTLHDAQKKIGGLAHVMLPDSRAIKENTNLAKFADSAIDWMIREMVKKGADREKIQAKIFGGANMFPSVTSRKLMQVGERNIQAVRAKLRQQAIPIIARDVGGHSGRTIFFELATGQVTVRMLKAEKEKIL